jgi:hypothetical protein
MNNTVGIEIEMLLIQVLQDKQTNNHPVLQYLSKRLSCLNFLLYSKSNTESDDGTFEQKLICLKSKFVSCLDIYQEFKKCVISCQTDQAVCATTSQK